MMQSQDTILQKYKKYKQKYMSLKQRLLQQGGVITKKQMEDHEKTLGPYWPYVYLFNTFVLKEIMLDGEKCDGDIQTVDLLNAGSNGFAAKFICSNGKIYVVKFILNIQFAWSNLSEVNNNKKTINDHIQVVNNDIKKEFDTINKYNSKQVMKAYKYFTFDRYTKKFTFNNGDIIKTTNIDESKQGDHTHNGVLPSFGGIILEYIGKQFENLPDDPKVLRIVFKQYLQGIKEINDKGFIHNDIKPDNLMFNEYKDDNGYTYEAKIIDLGAEKDMTMTNQTIQFTGATPDKEIIPICDSRVLTAYGDRKLDKSEQQIVKNITNAYDLYCLSRHFLRHFKKLDDEFKKLLIEFSPSCAVSPQMNNANALKLLDSLKQLS